MHVGSEPLRQGRGPPGQGGADAGPPRAARPDRPRGAGGRVRGRAHASATTPTCSPRTRCATRSTRWPRTTWVRSRRSRAGSPTTSWPPGPSVTRGAGADRGAPVGPARRARARVPARHRRHARVHASSGGDVTSGIEDLLVLKTTGSGWEGYLREQYTSLPETDDRILCTVVTASWDYCGRADYDAAWEAARDAILRHVRRPLQPVGAVHAAAARRGGARGGAGDRACALLAAEPPPPAVRPVAVRALRTTTRSSTRRRPRTG